MSGELFLDRFGVDPKSFQTVSDVNEYVERVTGAKLHIRGRHTHVVNPGGNVFEIVDRDPDKLVEKYLK